MSVLYISLDEIDYSSYWGTYYSFYLTTDLRSSFYYAASPIPFQNKVGSNIKRVF